MPFFIGQSAEIDMRTCSILDIGSSKAVCMIVSPDPDGAMIIRGTGVKEYNGFRLGELPRKRELYDAVSAAVEEAEQSAGIKIKELTVGVPSPFMEVVGTHGAVRIETKNGRIESEDVDYLIESSLKDQTPEGCSLIHSTAVSYFADKTPVTGSPVGLPCGVLSANVSHCFVDEDYKRLVGSILNNLGIGIESFVSTALAAACFTVPGNVRADSVFLVDCGGSFTDISLLTGNAIIATDSVPIGGKHFTSDLCFGLRLPRDVAEDLKRRYVFSLDYGDTCERVKIPGEGIFDIEHSLIQLIIESRAEELSDMLADKLDSLADRNVPVWLVGSGLASMRGAAEFLESRLGRNVSVTLPKVSRNGSMGYVSAFGLADFALFRLGRLSAVKRTERYLRSVFDWRS